MIFEGFPHLSNLPQSQTVLPFQMKQLLPIHNSCLRINVMTMLNQASKRMPWIVVPDMHLTLNSGNYQQILGGWCQDIDGQQNHLRKSLELGSVVINYVSAVITARINRKDTNNPVKHDHILRVEYISQEENMGGSRGAIAGSPLSIAYNIYKVTKDVKSRYLFLLGVNTDPQMSFLALVSNIRLWNKGRLKIKERPVGQQMGKMLEHLLAISRSFADNNDIELNVSPVQLGKAIKSLNLKTFGKNSDKSSEQLQRLKNDYLLKDTLLIVRKYSIIYQKQLTAPVANLALSRILAQCLQTIPKNSPSCFITRQDHNKLINEVSLVFILAYNRSNKKHTRLFNKENIEDSIHHIAQFIRSKTLEATKELSIDIADEIFRSSLQVFNKYQNIGWDRNEINNQIFDKSSDIMKSASQVKTMESRIQFNETNQVTLYRDNQYQAIVDLIERHESRFEKLLSPKQIRQSLIQNTKKAFDNYAAKQITADDHQLLLALASLPYQLQPVDILTLLQANLSSAACILQVLVQKSNYDFVCKLAKLIGRNHIEQLYQQYIFKGFVGNRETLLVLILKRMVCCYSESDSNILPANTLNEVSIPLLLTLLQKKQYKTEKYRQFVLQIIYQLFPRDSPIKVISPILYECSLKLLQDHHEQLVNSMLAQIIYEVIYFSCEGISKELDNSPYLNNVILKVKKTRQVLRDGGFGLLGLQVKCIVKPMILQWRQYSVPSSVIYCEMHISKWSVVRKMVSLLENSMTTASLSDVLQYFRFMGDRLRFRDGKEPIEAVFLMKECQGFKYSVIATETEETIFSQIKSESGIFNQLLAYNPKIKIAGMSLSKAIKSQSPTSKLSQSRNNIQKKFNADHVLRTELGINLQQIFDYIQITLSLRLKYASLSNLPQQELAYFQQISHKISTQRKTISRYLALDQAVKALRKGEIKGLF